MKKIIQFSAFLSLMFVFSVVFANAQRQVRRIVVNVPFEFSVEQKSYPAGKYQIRIVRISADAVSIFVTDAANNKLHTFIAPGKADVLTNDLPTVINSYKKLSYLGRVKSGSAMSSPVGAAADQRAAEQNLPIARTGGK